MFEKIVLDMLTQDSVSLVKQNYIKMEDGKEYAIGSPWRRAYVNSESGRIIMQNEVVEPYKSAILSIWGDTPTVIEVTQ